MTRGFIILAAVFLAVLFPLAALPLAALLLVVLDDPGIAFTRFAGSDDLPVRRVFAVATPLRAPPA